jgi:hypothetical protein
MEYLVLRGHWQSGKVWRYMYFSLEFLPQKKKNDPVIIILAI